MESAILNGMCRCCASEGVFKDVKTAYTWMGEEEVYADMLRECFNVGLSASEDGEDGGICEVCITQLRNASNFKKQVLHTEEQFKKHASNRLFKPSIVKVEMTPDEDNDSDDNNLSAEEGYSGPEFEVPIKTESEETKPKKRAAASKATTSRAKKAKTDNGESSTKRHPAETIKLKKEENETKLDGTRIKPKPDLSLAVPIHRQEIYKHRINVKEVLLWSNATPIRRFGDMGYMCCYCKTQCPKPADLKKHTLESHPDIKKGFFMKLSMDAFIIRLDITSLKCKICDQNIDSLEELMTHLRVDHKKTIYTDIKDHITPLKFNTETLQCFICKNKFNKFKLLLEHMNIHYRNYICNVCDTGFTSISSYRNHVQSHNTGTFKCKFCTLTFTTVSKKNSHERTKHTQKVCIYKCGYCNETFTEYRFKEAHLISMHDMKMPSPKCQACDKVFSSRHALSLHVRRYHLMDRRHKCTECDMKFFSNTDLKDHMIKHTKARAFKCTVCSKCFGRRYTLREHMKIHDDVRKFKCVHCGQAFIQKCSWKSHMKSKHGETV